MSQKKIHEGLHVYLSSKSLNKLDRADELRQKTATFLTQLNALYDKYNDIESISSSYLEIRQVRLGDGDYTRILLLTGIEKEIHEKKEQISGVCELIDNLLKDN